MQFSSTSLQNDSNRFQLMLVNSRLNSDPFYFTHEEKYLPVYVKTYLDVGKGGLELLTVAMNSLELIG